MPNNLLKHPDPRERALALKLSSCSPHDVAQAIIDPDPIVFKAALEHPHAHYALSVLASRTRDSKGNTLFDRHDALLAHPKFNKDHLRLMADAVRRDPKLPVKDAAARLAVLASKGYTDVAKKESWAHNFLHVGANKNLGVVSDHSKEETKEHLKPVKAAYESAHKEALEPSTAGLHGIGQVSPKVLYKVGDHSLMVKPYQEEDNPMSGFAESTSHDIYHAAGLGHLHQPSFVSKHGQGKYEIPATVIKLDHEAVPVHKAPISAVRQQNPALDDEARKISLMDFVTGNRDRHAGNLMVQKNGHLLAIDHARAFEAQPMSLAQAANKNGPGVITGGLAQHQGAYRDLLQNWWPSVSDKVKATFNSKAEGIMHPTFKKRATEAFNKRVAHLDNFNNGNFEQLVGGVE